jgi:hypothetical protein
MSKDIEERYMSRIIGKATVKQLCCYRSNSVMRMMLKTHTTEVPVNIREEADKLFEVIKSSRITRPFGLTSTTSSLSQELAESESPL